MASGDELTYLRDNPVDSVMLWTAKEAIQKAARKGMHLNPRKIKIPIGINEANISIEKSIFQLRNLVHGDFNVSIAICPGIGYDSIPEDDLLTQTLKAMSSNPDWEIGCKTTRKNN